MAIKRLKLGEILVAWGKLTEPQLQEALQQQPDIGKRLGKILTDRSWITDKDIAQALSEQLGIPIHDFAQAKTVDADVLSLVPAEYAQSHGLIPVALRGKELTVAMGDPLDFNAIQDLEFLTGMRIRIVIGLESDIRKQLQKYSNLNEMVSSLSKSLSPSLGAEVIREKEEPEPGELLRVSERAPIVRLVNAIFEDAIRKQASDVHIEPQEAEVHVRYRVDGLMRNVLTIPKYIQAPVTSRVKIMANLDISNRRAPQDGRMKLRVGTKEVDLRVSALPTINGEKMVVRILDQSQASLGLDELGFAGDLLEQLKDLLRRPQGMILVTGPTGSGKTTTLYAAVNFLKGMVTNIVTVEDPVEYKIDGINQVQINEKAGLTFASGLRSILRQDPNVILVGEIRDRETADIAFRSAQTGHLVLSTLHTNDAASAVTRLLDIGLEPFIFGSSLAGILAQRLVRRVCAECREPATPDPAVLARFDLKPGNQQFYWGSGCESCGSEGYRGRCGVHELLVVGDAVREKISARAPDREILQAARNLGMKTMAEDGLAKAIRGLTTLEEVLHNAPWPELGPDKDVFKGTVPLPQLTSARPASPAEVGRGDENEEDEKVPLQRPRRPGRRILRDRILVIDDSPTVVQLVQALLEAENFQVVTASDGLEGLEKVYQEAPDLIVTDAIMPRMDGFALVKKLKDHLSTRAIPVIMLTSRDETASEVQGLELGADDYITKPIEPERLLVRIKRALTRVRQER